MTLEGVAEAVGKLADRFDAIEKARGQRTAADGQDHSPVTKSSDKSFGIFG